MPCCTAGQAMSYRSGHHSTSDDSSRYRTAAEMQAWRARDPVARFQRHLIAAGWWDEAREAALRKAARAEVRVPGLGILPARCSGLCASAGPPCHGTCTCARRRQSGLRILLCRPVCVQGQVYIRLQLSCGALKATCVACLVFNGQGIVAKGALLAAAGGGGAECRTEAAQAAAGRDVHGCLCCTCPGIWRSSRRPPWSMPGGTLKRCRACPSSEFP